MTFVTTHRDLFGVEPILRVLKVPTSTFYDWVAQQRDPSRRRRQDAWLLAKIRAVHRRSGGTYGAPRVHAQLRRDGVQVSRKRVARLMGAHGLQGAFLRKRWRCSTRQDPTATRRPTWSTGTSPRQPQPAVGGRPLADPDRGGAAVAGECPRCVLAADRRLERQRPGRHRPGPWALEYAVWGRGLDDDPAQRRLIHHSDRGAQYTAIRFTQRLADAGIRPSMGSVGDSFDNALAENFFSTLKVELVYRTSFRTREEAELELFRYIDGWYNPHRIQKALGWRSPDEYEAAYHATLAAQPASSTIHSDPTGTR
jgi:putative transposase